MSGESEGASATGVSARSTMNRIASADELDHYIKVTNPSAWAVTLAALLLICGIIVWAIIAIVPVTVETTGITAQDTETGKTFVVCFVDRTTANRIQGEGVTATIDGIEAKSATLSDTPLSASEVVQTLGSDFYADSIKIDDWNYQIVIEPGAGFNPSDFTIETVAGQSHLVPVSIITSETRPINIILGEK